MQAKSTAIILLLNRCHARNVSQHYDAALADADAVLSLSPQNEKAIFRASRALYGLRRYEECLARLAELTALYPANLDARRDLDRCKLRLREKTGGHDFAAMLDEAVHKSPAPDMDRASYIGPVEVRQCAIRAHGRGLFTTKAVKIGELLLVEKAFSVAFPDSDDIEAPYDAVTGVRSSKPLQELGAELATLTLIKLRRNPSVMKDFASLYPGPDAQEHASVDDDFVQRRILYNAFAFPILPKDFHWRASHSPDSLAADPRGPNGCIGMWIQASFINHSCYPNLRRSFIGDMMIFRAQKDVPADTELKFGYIADFEGYAERQESLERYGFTCVCSICECQRTTPAQKIQERSMIMQGIIHSFEKSTATDIDDYFGLLKRLDQTYVHPPRKEPRRAFTIPCANLITACSQDKMPNQVVRLGVTLLRALGFEMNVAPTVFEITHWGLLTDEVITVLGDMRTACGEIDPSVVQQIEEVMRMAYLVMAGEDVSFEAACGICKPKLEG
ncbi:MAG: hypothetical protein Q9163_001576 [Psora crenata]